MYAVTQDEHGPMDEMKMLGIMSVMLDSDGDDDADIVMRVFFIYLEIFCISSKIAEQ